jgi:hypothetical protein
MESLKKLAISWTAMWALSYIVVAFEAPSISDVSPILYGLLGVILLVMSMVSAVEPEEATVNGILSLVYLFIAHLMVYGGVTSWTGTFIWNVPFEEKELFQVSMAFADFISAAVIIFLSGEAFNKAVK